MQYNLNGKIIDVVVEKKNNKNTYLRITDDNKIKVTTSYRVKDKDIIKLLEDNEEALLKMLNRVNKRKNRPFTLLGVKYDIVVDGSSFNVDDSSYIITTPNESVLENKLKSYAFHVFEVRLKYWYTNFNEKFKYPKLKVRRMKTRWGVCNRKNHTITINLSLIERDMKYIDYVIVHELSHFIHFNHSINFWKVVEKYIPNYKKLRKELKDY